MKNPNTFSIKDLCPGARFAITNDDLSTLEWFEDVPRPTDEEIIANIVIMKNREEAEAYRSSERTTTQILVIN